MNKITQQYINKSVAELNKEIEGLHLEIAKLEIEKRVKPQKDSNTIPKLKKKVAVALTIIRQKELGITK